MAHNFRDLSGAEYYSKSGHDSNDGLTPDTPRKTFPVGVTNVKKIIGAGIYPASNNAVGGEVKADGKVIIDGNNNDNYLNVMNANAVTYEGIEFRNMLSLDHYGSSGFNRFMQFTDCITRNITNLKSSHNSNDIIFTTSILKNVTQITDNLRPTKSYKFNSSIVINCDLLKFDFFINDTYVDKSTRLGLDTRSYSRNSNIRGVLQISGINFSDGVARLFAVQDQLTGSPQDNGYSAGVIWLTVNNLTANGFTGDINTMQISIDSLINREPLFNNEALEDFSLQAGSPHIGAAFDGTNIGGTYPAISVYNTSNGTSQIIPSPEIDTSNPNSYTVKVGETEGYIDYIEKVGSSLLVLKEIDPIAQLEFNSDVQGGNAGNRNVPDSEPLSFEYPRKLVTTSLAADALTLNVTGHDVAVGEFVRVSGQDREVTATTINTITVDSAFRAAVASGITFQVGAKIRIGALNPNRLTYMLRTSKQDNPQIDSDWDNDVDPIYNKAGFFLTQEWGEAPGYYIDTVNNEVWGSGDSETPPGLFKNEISCKWVQIRVYIRNNYES